LALDIAVGASLADGPNNDRVDAGEVYLFFGPFAADGSLDAGKGDYDVALYGAAAGDNLGRALAAADFNADGIEDLAIAAPSALERAGAIYVMFGGDVKSRVDFASTGADMLITGAAPGDYAGIAMDTGRLADQGQPSLVIGALLADSPDGSRADAGAVYMLQGQSLTAGESTSLGSVSSVIRGARAGDHLGESLAVGDFNGDGTDDLVVVATFAPGQDATHPGAGLTYVFVSPVTLPLDLASATPRYEVFGVDEGDQLGHSVAIADFDGDGASDLWLGAVSADGPNNSENLAGEAELVLGKPGPGGTGDDPIVLSAKATVYGPEPEARLGRSVAAGDINGDGQAELLVSAPNVQDRAGTVYVLSGGETLPETVSAAAVVIIGLDSGDILGHESLGTPALAVRYLDSEAVVLISAPAADGPGNDRVDCGEVYLIPGASLLR
jgi:hypothetical protein